jgi:hypothetical protein
VTQSMALSSGPWCSYPPVPCSTSVSSETIRWSCQLSPGDSGLGPTARLLVRGVKRVGKCASLSLSVRQFGTRLQLFAAIPSGDVPSVTCYNFFGSAQNIRTWIAWCKTWTYRTLKEQVLWSSMGRGGEYIVLH